ncbi:hypothetical protein CAOG_04394 [Capsaspora owczarzaki ATCC 30864]|nr:hypothetical protein CAOG_04394 [Capsaspora owczarzaki ATCC 30864]|eukprot:XP_004348222.1 hypothetical protein CAOG_04394 [Capsaspora owczarzaki ATCC 30864]
MSLTRENRDKIMDQMRQQMAVAHAQELLQKMSERCFVKCVVKPGTSLELSERQCVAKCMDRYMESWNVVSRAYANRIQTYSSDS